LSLLPSGAKKRKETPIATGVLDYFPKSMAEISRVSLAGNRQHFPPGTPLHWDRDKSVDDADALIRHFIERGTVDENGIRATARMAWRALAVLERELDAVEVTVQES
jgi:hypothetical protein